MITASQENMAEKVTRGLASNRRFDPTRRDSAGTGKTPSRDPPQSPGATIQRWMGGRFSARNIAGFLISLDADGQFALI